MHLLERCQHQVLNHARTGTTLGSVLDSCELGGECGVTNRISMKSELSSELGESLLRLNLGTMVAAVPISQVVNMMVSCLAISNTHNTGQGTQLLFEFTWYPGRS